MKKKNNNKILILDDEYLALSYLKDTIEDVISNISLLKNFIVLGTTNHNDFIKLLIEESPSIIFLDIQMPKKNGLEIAKDIRENYKKYGYEDPKLPIIIFVTAYENYGYQAFKVNAYDYILKPIDEEKIQDVFDSLLSQDNLLKLKEECEYIQVSNSEGEFEISVKDILYFKAEQKQVTVFTEKNSYFINDTLLNLECKNKYFVRTHRTFLVNPLYIEEILNNDNFLFIKLKNHLNLIPISRRQKIEFETKVDLKKFLK